MNSKEPFKNISGKCNQNLLVNKKIEAQTSKNNHTMSKNIHIMSKYYNPVFLETSISTPKCEYLQTIHKIQSFLDLKKSDSVSDKDEFSEFMEKGKKSLKEVKSKKVPNVAPVKQVSFSRHVEFLLVKEGSNRIQRQSLLMPISPCSKDGFEEKSNVKTKGLKSQK